MKKISLSGKNGKNCFTIIDDEDYNFIIKYRWHVKVCSNELFYAQTNVKTLNGKYKKIVMHRLLMKAKVGQQIDHINGKTFDNRKSNLRFCDTTLNQANSKPRKNCSSKYKGVRKLENKWQARIQKYYNPIHIGCFNNEIEAAKAYDKKAKEIFGEFARINFI